MKTVDATVVEEVGFGLLSLVSAWRKRAMKKFADAGMASGMEKRFIEHGAMCHGNAAAELESFIKKHLTPEEPDKT